MKSKSDETGMLWHVDEAGRFVWGHPDDRNQTISEREVEALQQLREKTFRDNGFNPEAERNEAETRSDYTPER